MKFKIEKNYKKTLILWSAIAIVLAAVAGALGDIMLPFAAASLAFVFVLSGFERRVVIILVALSALLACTVIGVVFNGAFTLLGLEVVAVAIVIAYAYVRGISKAGSAAIITGIVASCIVLSLCLYAMISSGEYTLGAVKLFYEEFLNAFKSDFSVRLNEMAGIYPDAEMQEMILAADVDVLLDSLSSIAVSLLIIVAFFLTGLTYKVFFALLMKYSDTPEEIMKWRFITPSLYGYFYIAISFISLLVASETDSVSIAVINLYNVFTFVYAYVGFNFALTMLSSRRSSGFAWMIMIVGIVMFSSISVQFLSVLGVLFTLYYNKTQGKTTVGNGQ